MSRDPTLPVAPVTTMVVVVVGIVDVVVAGDVAKAVDSTDEPNNHKAAKNT